MRTPGGGGGGGNIPRNRNGLVDSPRVYSNASPMLDRERGNHNDDMITRNKSPWMHKPYAIPPATGAADFDQKSNGPSRVELHLRTFTYREEAGDGHRDTTGMHTMLPKVRTNAGSRKPDTMTSARYNRLTTNIYRGQTYSETTQMQSTEQTSGSIYRKLANQGGV